MQLAWSIHLETITPKDQLAVFKNIVTGFLQRFEYSMNPHYPPRMVGFGRFFLNIYHSVIRFKNRLSNNLFSLRKNKYHRILVRINNFSYFSNIFYKYLYLRSVRFHVLHVILSLCAHALYDLRNFSIRFLTILGF